MNQMLQLRPTQNFGYSAHPPIFYIRTMHQAEREGNFQAVQRLVARAAQLFPRNANICYEASFIAERMGHPDVQGDYLRKALSADRDHRGAGFAYAMFLRKKGNLDSAEALFAELADNKSQFTGKLYRELSRLYEDRGQQDLAFGSYYMSLTSKSGARLISPDTPSNDPLQQEIDALVLRVSQRLARLRSRPRIVVEHKRTRSFGQR